MNLYKAFKTDPNMESGDGIDLDFGSAKFRVHRAGGSNQAFIEMMKARKRPLERQIAADTLDNGAAERLMAEVYAATVIKGWQGVTDADDKPLDFTPANCTKLLLDLPDLFRTIQEETTKLANFRKLEIDENAGALKNA